MNRPKELSLSATLGLRTSRAMDDGKLLPQHTPSLVSEGSSDIQWKDRYNEVRKKFLDLQIEINKRTDQTKSRQGELMQQIKATDGLNKKLNKEIQRMVPLVGKSQPKPSEIGEYPGRSYPAPHIPTYLPHAQTYTPSSSPLS